MVQHKNRENAIVATKSYDVHCLFTAFQAFPLSLTQWNMLSLFLLSTADFFQELDKNHKKIWTLFSSKKVLHKLS